MLVSGIKSRPTYRGLQPDRFAKENIVVTDAPGCEAVIDMVRQADDDFATRLTILLCRIGVNGKDPVEALKPLGAARLWVFPTLETGIARLNGALSTARMSTRLYAAGTEPLIGSVISTALKHGIAHNSVFTEHRGSLRRRVQCVHCKGLTDNVTTNPVKCAHCGLTLIVRDHYSRRHAAFMGVCIDAEAPGEIPEAKAEFQ
jgi:hypothetical protein